MIDLPAGLPNKADIEKTTIRIKEYINKTPVLSCQTLNKISNANLFFKCENFQKAGAFKTRGAVNAVFSLPEIIARAGVCTHSSGNHAAALSRAAKLRNIPAYVVMPDNSSPIKIKAVKNYGGIITFCEPTLEARESTLAKTQKQTGATMIHPYDDLRIIAGQATATYELISEIPHPDFIIAPVGGGGLLSGTALASHYFSPSTKVIAAEPLNANDAYRSFKEKRFIPSDNPKTIADGLLTSLGNYTFPVIMKYVHDIVTVTEEEIVNAMRTVWERMKIIIEPSSAVAVAAVLQKKFDTQNKTIGIIISGGNVDLDLLPWSKQ